MLYAFNENFVLPFSHDEVVHGKGSMIGKMSGDSWQKAANLRALYAYMYVHPGKKLLFMGSELAAWREWDDADGLPWAWADDARTPACGRWCAISTGCIASRRRCIRSISSRPASAGSTATTPSTASSH